MQRFYIFTQGCKINQYESQAIRESWLGHPDLAETREPEQADMVLVNSCAVTDRAIQDLRKAVRRLHRCRPGAGILVTGCAARIFHQQIRDLPGVTAVLPQALKPELCRLGPVQGQTLDPGLETAVKGTGFPRAFPALSITRYPRARPVLKIQDGCSQGCIYCIVPLTRGPARSRHPGEILREARALAQAGYRELVISGINLSQYTGGPGQGPDFWDLIQWLDKHLKKVYQRSIRLRLSSLDPGLLSTKGLSVLQQAELVCPHLHLSIQSASPAVLRAMGRNHYTPEWLSDVISRIKAFWPTFGLGADFLLGFPGESTANFQETVDFFRAQPFSYAHIFSYSPRPGTRAAALTDRVEAGDRKRRSRQLRELAAEKRRLFLHSLLEIPDMEILLEQSDPALGLNEYYTLCLLEPAKVEAPPGHLLRAAPLGLNEEGLLVRSLD